MSAETGAAVSASSATAMPRMRASDDASRKMEVGRAFNCIATAPNGLACKIPGTNLTRKFRPFVDMPAARTRRAGIIRRLRLRNYQRGDAAPAAEADLSGDTVHADT